jgi:hypothetical protein
LSEKKNVRALFKLEDGDSLGLALALPVELGASSGYMFWAAISFLPEA